MSVDLTEVENSVSKQVSATLTLSKASLASKVLTIQADTSYYGREGTYNWQGMYALFAAEAESRSVTIGTAFTRKTKTFASVSAEDAEALVTLLGEMLSAQLRALRTEQTTAFLNSPQYRPDFQKLCIQWAERTIEEFKLAMHARTPSTVVVEISDLRNDAERQWVAIRKVVEGRVNTFAAEEVKKLNSRLRGVGRGRGRPDDLLFDRGYAYQLHDDVLRNQVDAIFRVYPDVLTEFDADAPSTVLDEHITRHVGEMRDEFFQKHKARIKSNITDREFGDESALTEPPTEAELAIDASIKGQLASLLQKRRPVVPVSAAPVTLSGWSGSMPRDVKTLEDVVEHIESKTEVTEGSTMEVQLAALVTGELGIRSREFAHEVQTKMEDLNRRGLLNGGLRNVLAGQNIADLFVKEIPNRLGIFARAIRKMAQSQTLSDEQCLKLANLFENESRNHVNALYMSLDSKGTGDCANVFLSVAPGLIHGARHDLVLTLTPKPAPTSTAIPLTPIPPVALPKTREDGLLRHPLLVSIVGGAILLIGGLWVYNYQKTRIDRGEEERKVRRDERKELVRTVGPSIERCNTAIGAATQMLQRKPSTPMTEAEFDTVCKLESLTSSVTQERIRQYFTPQLAVSYGNYVASLVKFDEVPYRATVPELTADKKNGQQLLIGLLKYQDP